MSSGHGSEVTKDEGRSTEGKHAVKQNALLEVLRRYWGFDSVRPLQGEAMAAVLDRRDSLLVLPTGGGKSLCYQAPRPR